MGTSLEYRMATGYGGADKGPNLRMAIASWHGLQPAETLYPFGAWCLYHHSSHEVLDFIICAYCTIRTILIENSYQWSFGEMLSEGNKPAFPISNRDLGILLW